MKTNQKMSFFRPLYIIDEKQQQQCKKNNNVFEYHNIPSLECLKLTNEFAKTILEDFKPYKWKNKVWNVLNIDDIKKSTILQHECFDSLYINNNNNDNNDNNDDENTIFKPSDIKLMYISPHIIFYNQSNGYCTLDIMTTGIIPNIENVAILPLFKFRSYDNKSIEFIKNDNNFMSFRHLTLKTFCEYNSHNYKASIVKYRDFIDNVYNFFIESKFIPYLVHPNRLILYKNENLKLISSNLLQYIFYPHISKLKIKDNLYSHPKNLIIREQKEVLSLNFTEKMMKDVIDLFLDFFHSSFVTLLWIIHTNNNLYPENQICRNMDNFIYNINATKKTKKQKNVITYDDYYNKYMYSESDRYICNNVFGFCLNYHNNEKLYNIIHNYGCKHLQFIMPSVLENSIKHAVDKNDDADIFISSVKLQFEIFTSLMSEILKNNE